MDGPWDESEPVRIPIGDVLDLHSIPPKDVGAVVEEYLLEARVSGATDYSRTRNRGATGAGAGDFGAYSGGGGVWGCSGGGGRLGGYCRDVGFVVVHRPEAYATSYAIKQLGRGLLWRRLGMLRRKRDRGLLS